MHSKPLPLLLPSLLCGALALAAAQTAHAAVNLVQNGGFELTNPYGHTVPGNNGGGQVDYNVGLTAWWTDPGHTVPVPFDLVFTSGSADTTGLTTMLADPVLLWGPNSHSANGLPASSPAGGNFLAADAADDVGAINQSISGLTPNEVYQLSFVWGGVAQAGYTVPTREQWQVSLGAESHSTAVVDVASKGFSGWMSQSFNFTATSPTELLSFLAVGGPVATPPFALLDGVSLVDTGTQASPVPEPSTVFAGGATFLLLAGAGVRRMLARRKLG